MPVTAVYEPTQFGYMGQVEKVAALDWSAYWTLPGSDIGIRLSRSTIGTRGSSTGMIMFGPAEAEGSVAVLPRPAFASWVAVGGVIGSPCAMPGIGMRRHRLCQCAIELGTRQQCDARQERSTAVRHVKLPVHGMVRHGVIDERDAKAAAITDAKVLLSTDCHRRIMLP